MVECLVDFQEVAVFDSCPAYQASISSPCPPAILFHQSGDFLNCRGENPQFEAYSKRQTKYFLLTRNVFDAVLQYQRK